MKNHCPESPSRIRCVQHTSSHTDKAQSLHTAPHDTWQHIKSKSYLFSSAEQGPRDSIKRSLLRTALITLSESCTDQSSSVQQNQFTRHTYLLVLEGETRFDISVLHFGEVGMVWSTEIIQPGIKLSKVIRHHLQEKLLNADIGKLSN